MHSFVSLCNENQAFQSLAAATRTMKERKTQMKASREVKHSH